MPMRAIIPDPINEAAFRNAINKGLNDIGTGIRQDFLDTVAKWRGEQPGWSVKVVSMESVSTLINGSNRAIEKYGYVNDGTDPHPIVPTQGNVLVFEANYKAGSSPGTLETTAPSSDGNLVFTKAVDHPGSKGRHHDELIAAKWQPKLETRMQEAVDEGARNSGHAI